MVGADALISVQCDPLVRYTPLVPVSAIAVSLCQIWGVVLGVLVGKLLGEGSNIRRSRREIKVFVFTQVIIFII